MSSSSSSDSDSDDEFEPVRKIKIAIRPKDDSTRSKAADVSQIKASVDAWRPLGPKTHPSLARRQSSLSSVSSMSFGASSSAYGSPFGTTTSVANFANGFSEHSQIPFNNNNSNNNNILTDQQSNNHHLGSLRPSPSCSSLVSEYTSNRPPFGNLLNPVSRTSSPLTLIGQTDATPIAIAIQETLELIVRGHYDPNAQEPQFDTQALGNIKIAFPNAFARNCATKAKTNSPLRLKMHSVDNITKFFASGLIKDEAFRNNYQPDPAGSSMFEEITALEEDKTKLVEFDMEKLSDQLKKLYDQASTSRYYNVDFLRYQIKPIESIEQAPLQVCAYWRIQDGQVKLRINFKHSTSCGLSLERLRDITFMVDLSNLIPPNLEISASIPESISSAKLHNNNNNICAMTSLNLKQHTLRNSSQDGLFGYNLPDERILPTSLANNGPTLPPPPTTSNRNRGSSVSSTRSLRTDVLSNTMALPRSRAQSSTQNLESSTVLRDAQNNSIRQSSDLIGGLLSETHLITGQHIDCKPSTKTDTTLLINGHKKPSLAFEPRGIWNSSTRQLTWRFDTLLAFRNTDGSGSLFAKIDSLGSQGETLIISPDVQPAPVIVKYFITDSTLSKVNLSLDSLGYRVTLMKKEIRTGRYKSEPYMIV